jgi:hypothetical protein
LFPLLPRQSSTADFNRLHLTFSLTNQGKEDIAPPENFKDLIKFIRGYG